MEIVIKKFAAEEWERDFKMPEKATPEAACWDVYAREIVVNAKEGKVVVKLGFETALPDDMCMVIVPRSGITKSRWVLQNSPGQVDPDYRGEYQMRFIGIPNIEVLEETNQLSIEIGEFPYKVGERVGQMYLRPIIPIEFKEVDILPESVRGEGGYGSTGNE